MTMKELVSWVESWDERKVGKIHDFRQLMHELGDPQDQLRYIHVAGTNGKGSACAMMASVLRAAGYKTGLYTSPHLLVYNDRIQINGIMIPDEDFTRLGDKVRAVSDTFTCRISVFQKLTAIAFLWFAEQACDFVVLEVGRGGIADATNIIRQPLVSLIMNIGLEHMEVLGWTIPEITEKKAGIIKENAPVVLFHQTAEAEEVVRSRAKELHAPLTITKPEDGAILRVLPDHQEFSYKNRVGLRIPFIAPYQFCNALVVLDAIDALCHQGFCISDYAVREGLASVTWPGRFELLSEAPLIYADGAHNPNGAEALRDTLQAVFPNRKLVFILTVLKERNREEMLAPILPHAAHFVTVKSPSSSSAEAPELAEYINTHSSVPATAAESLEDAFQKAASISGGEVPILVFGCLYLVSAAHRYFRGDDFSRK